MKHQASRCGELINFPSPKLAPLSICEKVKLETNSIPVPQGQTLF